MGLKSDGWIKRRCLASLGAKTEMIWPFCDKSVNRDRNLAPITSYGLTSYGYDIRLADEFALFHPSISVIDPKQELRHVGDIKHDFVMLLPGQFALGRSVEYFRMPRNVVGEVKGKSTLARCGLIMPVTPLEPEWEGHITLELFNGSGRTLKVYANEGVAQVQFVEGDEDCEVSYADKKGKYQGQTGITFPRMY